MSAAGRYPYRPVYRGLATRGFLFCLVLLSSIYATLADSGSTDAMSSPDELGPELLHFPVHRRGGPAGFTWRHAKTRTADAGGDANVSNGGGGGGSGDGDANEDQDDDVVNFSILDAELHRVAARFHMTKREMRGNKVVRKAKVEYERQLMGRVGDDGKWFTKFRIGDPDQTVQVDVDMLTSDFFLYTTTSRTGSQFFDFHSQTYEQSNVRPFPRCILPKDILHLPSSAEQNIHQSVPISFAHCRPSKSSIDTLRPSGAMLGLAPGRSLSQMHSNTFSSSPPPPPSLSQQLFDLGTIRRKIWSLMFIDAQHAVLSLGGSAASIVRNVEDSTREQLDRLGELERMAAAGRGGADAEPETDGGAGMPQSVDEEKVIAAAAVEPGSGPLPDDGTELPTKRKRDLDSDFGTARDASPFDGAVRNKKKALEWTWSKLQGAEGWWQVLMQGIWIGGRRVLKNQYVILDISTPFILTPSSSSFAIKKFYAAIPGSRRLAAPHDHFYSFPCLNPPSVQFEFIGPTHGIDDVGGSSGDAAGRSSGRIAAVKVDVLKGAKAEDRGNDTRGWVIGGKFSLGRVNRGSGYCVGAVVDGSVLRRRQASSPATSSSSSSSSRPSSASLTPLKTSVDPLPTAPPTPLTNNSTTLNENTPPYSNFTAQTLVQANSTSSADAHVPKLETVTNHLENGTALGKRNLHKLNVQSEEIDWHSRVAGGDADGDADSHVNAENRRGAAYEQPAGNTLLENGANSANDVENMWILGEAFLWSVDTVFDIDCGRVGFRQH